MTLIKARCAISTSREFVFVAPPYTGTHYTKTDCTKASYISSKDFLMNLTVFSFFNFLPLNAQKLLYKYKTTLRPKCVDHKVSIRQIIDVLYASYCRAKRADWYCDVLFFVTTLLTYFFNETIDGLKKIELEL